MLLLAPLSAMADLPETMETAGGELQRCANQAIRVIGVINVGHSGLYLEDCDDAGRILESVPKQFTLELARDFAGEDLRASAREHLVKNLDFDSEEDIAGSLACMADAYVDGVDGDRFDVRYLPEEGLSLHHNDEEIAHCGNDDGSEKYFVIWFGDDPFSNRLKRRLLDGALER